MTDIPDQQQRYRDLLRRKHLSAPAEPIEPSPSPVLSIPGELTALVPTGIPPAPGTPPASGAPPAAFAAPAAPAGVGITHTLPSSICSVLAKGSGLLAGIGLTGFLAALPTIWNKLTGILMIAILGNIFLLTLCALLFYVLAEVLRPGGKNG